MFIKNYNYLMILITATVILNSCFLVQPPPYNVNSIISVNQNNEIEFTYWPQIQNESYFDRTYYYLYHVRAQTDNCYNNPNCPLIVWEIENTAVPKKVYPNKLLIDLPKNIIFGESITGMQTIVPASVLNPNIRYFIRIGIIGVDENYKNRIHFSAEAWFQVDKKLDTIMVKQL